MAVRFGLNQAAYIESAVVDAYPFTLACWFRVRTVALDHPLMWVGDKDVADYCCWLEARGSAVGDPLRALAHKHEAANYREALKTAFTAETWYHGAALFTGNASRQSLLDGVAGAANTNAGGSPAGYDRTALGALMDSTAAYANWQEIAYAAIWSIAQTPTVIADLAAGACPLKYPTGLEAFWPLGGEYGENYLDRSGNGHDLTTLGTPTFVDDPPLLPYRLPLGTQEAQVFGW